MVQMVYTWYEYTHVLRIQRNSYKTLFVPTSIVIVTLPVRVRFRCQGVIYSWLSAGDPWGSAAGCRQAIQLVVKMSVAAAKHWCIRQRLVECRNPPATKKTCRSPRKLRPLDPARTWTARRPARRPPRGCRPIVTVAHPLKSRRFPRVRRGWRWRCRCRRGRRNSAHFFVCNTVRSKPAFWQRRAPDIGVYFCPVRGPELFTGLD